MRPETVGQDVYVRPHSPSTLGLPLLLLLLLLLFSAIVHTFFFN